MAGMQNFRSALNGFNRKDVVQYIEYLNNQHNAQIEQLNTQLQNAQETLSRVKTTPDTDNLQAQLDATLEKCAQLEAKLAEGGVASPVVGDELEAYRRAERAERLARDRAAQIYEQANAALADATLKVEAISDGMNTISQQVTAQIQQAKQDMQEAVASLYAIRPTEE